MLMFISSKNINGTQKMDVSQPYCVFNYCTTADHKSHYSSLLARISIMRRYFLVLFLLPVVSMPQRENSLSTNACEAGADIRSRATSATTERLSHCRQNSAVLRQVVHHCVAGRCHSYTCCSVCQLSCQMWKCRRDDRICNCRSVSNTPSTSTRPR